MHILFPLGNKNGKQHESDDIGRWPWHTYEKIGEETPKALLLINNRPLIVYHLENLAKAGYKEVVINVCAHADKIKNIKRG